MPPAANDNQGLKIAVAVFATLAFLLAIATYFGFSQASQNWERYTEESKKASQATQAQNELLNSLNEFKAGVGYEKADNKELRAQLDADQKKLTDAVNALRQRVEEIYASYKGADGSNAQVDEFARQANSIAERITSDRSRTLSSAIAGLTDLLTNETQLLGAVASDYQGTRRALEQSNQVAQSKVNEVAKARDQSDADRLEQARKHEEDRKATLSRLDELQTRNQQQATEITTLKTELAQLQEDSQRKFNDLLAQFRGVREQLEKADVTSLQESPNGSITYVDNTRGEVRTTLSRRQGAKERMVFSVFDREAAGIPTDTAKGTIELIRVTDSGSIGRILKTTNSIQPISAGDFLYSPAFGARPRLFALIGKIDMNRDGRDDREDLKRMIRSRGGEVVYDLPPAGIGQETGELTPLTSWYVLDDQQAIRAGAEIPTGATAEEEDRFNKRKSEVLQEARMAGVRPISLERLLSMLGYSYGEVNPGQVEGLDRRALQRVTNPRGAAGGGVPITPPPSGTDDNAEAGGF
jgi:predicted nuclease with TOPRIM domain